MNREQYDKWLAENRIWFGKKGDARPMLKRFLTDAQDGLTPNTWWDHAFAGHNKEATLELKQIFSGESPFDTPKPVKLLTRILQVFSDKDSLVLDSFAGSGTTGHACLKLNAEDGGQRQFILIEMDEGIATSATAVRLRQVIEGYEAQVTLKSKRQEAGLGGGFRFCKLGAGLFDDAGNIAGEVKFPDLAAHVFFTETGVPIPKRAKADCPLLGVHHGRAVYLLFNGILGDKRPAGGNVLTHSVAQDLPAHPAGKGPRVVYGEACRLGPKSLEQYGITFRQVPFELKVD